MTPILLSFDDYVLRETRGAMVHLGARPRLFQSRRAHSRLLMAVPVAIHSLSSRRGIPATN